MVTVEEIKSDDRLSVRMFTTREVDEVWRAVKATESAIDIYQEFAQRLQLAFIKRNGLRPPPERVKP
jgi:hypothetical protein